LSDRVYEGGSWWSQSLVGLREDLEQAVALAADQGVQGSSVEDLDREESALHNPVIVDIGQVASTVSLIFAAGTSAVVFIDKLRDIIRRRQVASRSPVPIEVNDANTNERLGSLDDSDAEQLKERLEELNQG
jgi:hypothetical protein